MKIHVNADDSRKYITSPLNPSETLRANFLFNSVILFDRTGEYSEIKQMDIFHKFYFDNLAEVYPPIAEEIEMKLEANAVKEFTKTKTKNM